MKRKYNVKIIFSFFGLNSHNNVIYAGGKKVILLDVDDIFVIESDDLIVVGKKEQISKVHELRTKEQK